ncbi:ROK family protein [Lacticaseibacillus paracasei]|uniref:ROK family protein n=1 Tax=Lacticaseibacillus paracasei TaxID=1597 RepID=UPI002ADEC789|nr:ROK family protein [Lacticaseibacillus paracasei]MEA0974149.1 ROK family protein [Lacticaseibacillus paracasei]
MTKNRYGSIEAGGTKFIVAVADESYRTIAQQRIKTETPPITLQHCLEFFQENPVTSLSIGTFGPVYIDPSNSKYGEIGNTPKSGWTGANMIAFFKQNLNIPVCITTDVNASAYGEYQLANGSHLRSLAYITIGTGIGAGVIEDGKFAGVKAHPELGHLYVEPRDDDNYAGGCPYHRNHCIEGLASGPTIEARTGKRGERLDRNNPVFDLVSYYTAALVWDVYCSFRPERIIIGGSVLNEDNLKVVRRYFTERNNGYLETPDLTALISGPLAVNNGSATFGNYCLAARNRN